MSFLFKKKSKKATNQSSSPTSNEHRHILSDSGPSHSITSRILIYKDCGHNDCMLDNPTSCCECGDKRPFQTYYEGEIDGRGYLKSAFRHTFYCTACKNRVQKYSNPQHAGNSNSNSSSNSNTQRNPYCQHHMLLSNCTICSSILEMEQQAVKDAVMRLGFPMNQVTAAANIIPNKEGIRSSQEFLVRILDTMENQQKKSGNNSNDPQQLKQITSPLPRSYSNPLPSAPPPLPSAPPPFSPEYGQIPNSITNPFANNQPTYPAIHITNPFLQMNEEPRNSFLYSNSTLPTNGINQIQLDPPPVEGEADECKVCFESAMNSVLIPCGHLALCHNCAIQIINTTKKCPICRMEVASAVQTYKA